MNKIIKAINDNKIKLNKHIEEYAELIKNTRFVTAYEDTEESFDHAFGTHSWTEPEVTEQYDDGIADEKRLRELWASIADKVETGYNNLINIVKGNGSADTIYAAIDSLDKEFKPVDDFFCELYDHYEDLKVDGDYDWNDDDLPPDLEESGIVDNVTYPLFYEIKEIYTK